MRTIEILKKYLDEAYLEKEMQNKTEEEIWFCRLENTRGSHNKYYSIRILKSDTYYLLQTSWGRINNFRPWSTKNTLSSLHIAENAAENLKKEKIGRGYDLKTLEGTTEKAKKKKKEIKVKKLSKRSGEKRFGALFSK